MSAEMMSYTQAVFERRSARSYDGKLLQGDDAIMVDTILSRMPKCHFGRSTVRLKHISCPDGTSVPGTYGCINGARDYLVAYTSQSVTPLTLIDTGLICELVALKALCHGFGTCLMTGSVRDGQFAQAAGLGGADSLLLASPIGHVRSPRLAEVIISRMSRSNTRHPLEKVVFDDEDMTHPWIPKSGDEVFRHALEGLLRAPSAYNRQPWRVVVRPETIEIHSADTDSNSWIGIGAAACNYCVIIGIRSEDLEVVGTAEKPVIIAPRPL